MKFFDSKEASEKLEARILAAPVSAKNRTLLIVQIGNNIASEKYIELKQKFCQKFEIACEVYKFDGANYQEIEDFLQNSSHDPVVGSLIVQLPLPDSKLYPLLDLLPLEKDIDILSSNAKSDGLIQNAQHLSPILRATEYFIYSTDLDYDSIKKVGIIGYGYLVGQPLEKYLSSKFTNVEVIHDYVSSSKLDFDLLILATDIPNLVKGENISTNCNVIDFGSSVVNGKTVGNLDLNSQLGHLGLVSKSPGGMGPLVVRFLVMNHLRI